MARPPRAPEPVSQPLLVVTSLGLALLVWILVKQGELTTERFTIRVDYVNVPPVVELADVQPQSIDVLFSYPKTRERDALSDNFRAVIDASFLKRRANPGDFQAYEWSLQANQVEAPRDFRFVDFSLNPSVTFTARLRVAQAKVQPYLIGDPPAGFIVDRERILVEPQEITVAVNQARALEAQGGSLEIYTVPIDVAGKQQVVSGLFAIDYNRTAGVEPIQEQSQEVRVTIPIEEKPVTVTFDDLPVVYEPLNSKVYAVVEPSTVQVRLTGPANLISRVRQDMVRLTTRRFLDEQPGSSTQTLLEVAYNTADPELTRRLATDVRLEIIPRVAQIQFLAFETPAPTATPAAPPRTPTATVSATAADGSSTGTLPTARPWTRRSTETLTLVPTAPPPPLPVPQPDVR